ncbi:MAG: hypothetical protein AAFW98_17250, partial [Pseudomonadota bacterium]
MGPVSRTAIFAAIVLVGLAGYALIAARSMEQAQAALSDAQLRFVMSRAAEAIERNMRLGLPLAELQQAAPILENTLTRAPSILAADAFSADGTTLFSTDRGAVGEPVPPLWRAAIAERRGETFEAIALGHVTLGQPIRNDFGQIEGWAAIIVDRHATAAPLSRASQFLIAAAPITGIAALLAALVGWFGIRGLMFWRRQGGDPFGGGGASAMLDKTTARATLTCENAAAALDEAE